MSGERDRVTGHVVLDALKAVDGISCPPPGGSRGVINYVRLQHDGKTLAHAIALASGDARLRYLAIDASKLPKAAIGDLRITGEGAVIVAEANVAQGVKLVKYLVVQHDLGKAATAIKPAKAAVSPVPKTRQRAWLRDEQILALDLYFSEGPNGSSDSIQSLSDTLRQFPIERHLADDVTFRSTASVKTKLANFRALDPNISGGLEHGSEGDAEVWAEFTNDRSRLRGVAEAIRATLASPTATAEIADIGDEGDDFVEAEEGALLTRLHRTRERNRRLILAKKKKVLKALGRLPCEVCSFDFVEAYGDLGSEFVECHHTVPVSQLTPGSKTGLDDLALVCANCHRMLHRRKPWLTVEQLRTIIKPR
jgi:5-methylcytosine-specific restriction protein A